LIQDTAYDTLLRSRRQEIHARIAQVLKEADEVEPELIAHHFTNAGLFLEAVPEWLRAGQQAVARSANIEAIAHLTRGLGIVRSLPDSTTTRHIELAMQISLGSAQIAARGYSAIETEQAYVRARELLTEEDDPRTFAVLHGLAMVYWNKAQLPAMSNVAEDMIMRANRVGGRVSTLVAHRVMTVALNTTGRFNEACEYGTRAVSLYDPKQDYQTAHLFGHDQGVGSLCHLAIALTFLGNDTQAKTTAVNAAELARSLNNANTMLYNSLWSSFMSVVRCDWAEAHETATAMVAEAEERSMALWAVFGRHFLGCSLIGRGAAEAGLAEIHRARSDAEKLKNRIFLPMTLSFEAQALASLGRFDEALCQTGLAMRAIEETGELWWQAEVYRIEGETLIASGRPHAENRMRRALEIADQQKAKLLQERARAGIADAALH
jgi:tetratricopeptide (TPR) repeat protein